MGQRKVIEKNNIYITFCIKALRRLLNKHNFYF